VSTYGRLARQAGAEGGARAAGRALAENPFPIVVPCHRTVRSNGDLGGYQGGVQMKRALLEMEGVAFDERGRVVLHRVYYV
jgi:methylated-DNA-[protein]-cysteine S-methyltransferase